LRNIRFGFGRKNFTTFILATAVLIYALYSSVDGLVYYFSDASPTQIGDAMDPDMDAYSKIKDGDFVEIKGITSLQGGSLEKGFLGKKHFLYYFNGSDKFIVIEPSSDEEMRSPARKTVRGRAHRFATSGQAQRMREFFLKSLYIEMSDDGVFIESGLEPGKDHKAPLFFGFLLALMALNIILFLKYLKKDNSPEEDLDDF
jgi:hypothetical protein